jgi:hypothetical protein
MKNKIEIEIYPGRVRKKASHGEWPLLTRGGYFRKPG